jgi:hypothetical protein
MTATYYYLRWSVDSCLDVYWFLLHSYTDLIFDL